MSKTDKRLIIFVRFPEEGTEKKRLVPELGKTGAANLSKKMTERTLESVQNICRLKNIKMEIRFEGGSDSLMKSWLGVEKIYRPQDEGTLGDRMLHALEDAFCEGVRKVALIRTDCPELDQIIISEAFNSLDDHDLVLGPSKNGGNYLIGLKKSMPCLFEDRTWVEDEVFERTISAAKSKKLSTKILPVLSNVDRPEDLVVWEETLNEIGSPQFSIIIPTLNEEKYIAKSIESVGAKGNNNVELIVVDGGSADKTSKIAKEMGAIVMSAPKGRALQMNAGAEIASGKVLLFLHADSCLPADYFEPINETLGDPKVMAGAFTLRFDSDNSTLRFLEKTALFRSKKLELPYGNQGIFMLREVFERFGGFPEIPLREDVEFMQRLKKYGKIVTLSKPIFTSGRRYEENGPLKTIIKNQFLLALKYLGMSPDRVAKWYYKTRPRNNHDKENTLEGE